MLKQVDGKVSPEMITAIFQIEQADTMNAILKLMQDQVPIGNFRPFKINVSTQGSMYFIGHSQAFINDGPADVYFLERNDPPTADDAPLKSTDPAFELRPGQYRKENGGLGILRWLRTASGTATVRVFPLE